MVSCVLILAMEKMQKNKLESSNTMREPKTQSQKNRFSLKTLNAESEGSVSINATSIHDHASVESIIFDILKKLILKGCNFVTSHFF